MNNMMLILLICKIFNTSNNPLPAYESALAAGLDLRANSIYPYTQLILAACQQTSRSKTSQTERITFDITNADGDIQGNGTSVYQYHTSLPSVVLAKNDTLTVTLFHCMARDVLPGIIDFGLTVDPINVNH